MIAVLVAAVVSGKAISVSGAYTPIMVPAGLFVVAGVAIMTTFTETSPSTLWIPSLVLLGIGSGSAVSAPFIAAQSTLAASDLSVGMAFMTFSQDIGEALFISIAQTIFLNQLTRIIEENTPTVNPATAINAGATYVRQLVPADELPAVLLSYNTAVKSTFYLAVSLAGSVVVASLMIKKNPFSMAREMK